MRIKSKDELYEGGVAISTSCEKEEKCCFVIDIKIGVKILALGTIAGTVLEYIRSFSLFYGNEHDRSVISGLLFIVASLPLVLASYFCVKFLMDDNQETRNGLTRGGLLVCFYWVIGTAVAVVCDLLFGAFAGSGDSKDKLGTSMGFLLLGIFMLCLNYYYMKVYKRFSNQL